MANTGRTANGGYAVRAHAAAPWQEVDQETYEAAKRSGIENVMREAGSRLADTGGTLIETFDQVNPFSGINPLGPQIDLTETGRAIRQSNDDAQAARAEVAPVASTIGRGLALGAELAVPAAPLSRAAIGAARATSAGQRAVTGSQRGVQIAEDAAGAVPPANRSLSAAETGPDAPAYQGNLRLEGMTDVDDLDAMGIPLTPGDRAALAARNGDELTQAQGMRANEFLRTSGDLGSVDNVMDIFEGTSATKQAQESALTRRLATELGDPNVENLTRGARQRIRSEVQSVFREYIDEGTEPIPAQLMSDQAQAIADAATGNAKDQALKHVNEIVSKRQPDGSFDRKAFSSVRKSIMDDMETAFNVGNYELGQTLSQLTEVMDDALEATLDEGAVATLQEARRRWRLLKALERRRATDPSGELNPRTFQAAYEAVTPAFRRAARPADDFETFLDTVVFLTTPTQPDSGTAQRVGQMLRGRSAASFLGFGN